MRLSFYPKLAWSGIKKNCRLYIPYLLTCILMVGIYYILSYLSEAPVLQHMSGGGSLGFILQLGKFVILAFAILFLFYTNSFLMKVRMKEFGLYHILGMNKANIGKLLGWESLINYGIAMIGGLSFGIAISKLSELGLINLVEANIDYHFAIGVNALKTSLVFFALVFFLIYLNGLRKIGYRKTIELLKSNQMGEKPPKANWLMGLLGILLLAGAYWLAISIEQPLSALVFFFIAVIMVIAATYLIFIASSVLLCRVLQRNKNYYYKPNHFVSVSSMAYRMKRNGAGLASICILLTMVLVMISSSSCLYFGADDCMKARYPKQICAFTSNYGYYLDDTYERRGNALEEVVEKNIRESGAKLENQRVYDTYSITGYYENGQVKINLNSKSQMAFIDYDRVVQVNFVDIKDYNEIYQQDVQLQEGEALAYVVKAKNVGDELGVGDLRFHLKKVPKEVDFDLTGSTEAAVTSTVFLMVNDARKIAESYQGCLDYDGTPMLVWAWYNEFDTNLDVNQGVQLANAIEESMREVLQDVQFTNFYCDNHQSQRSDYLAGFGGLFFIGILLSVVFLVAAVLIIYYKQLSEGLEDQARFAIMQKVGMTKGEIRASITSQMITVFFLPIIFAVMHLAFAFPMINKMLMLFGLFNVKLLLMTTAVIVFVCGVFYLVVYRITSRSYFKIVSK